MFIVVKTLRSVHAGNASRYDYAIQDEGWSSAEQGEREINKIEFATIRVTASRTRISR